MRSKDNANVGFCVENLLKTFKKEVPYAREKGIDHGILDLPVGEVEVELAESADLCILKYEPRVNADDINEDIVNDHGKYTYKVELETESEE